MAGGPDAAQRPGPRALFRYGGMEGGMARVGEAEALMDRALALIEGARNDVARRADEAAYWKARCLAAEAKRPSAEAGAHANNKRRAADDASGSEARGCSPRSPLEGGDAMFDDDATSSAPADLVLVVAKPQAPEAEAALRDVVRWLASRGCHALVAPAHAPHAASPNAWTWTRGGALAPAASAADDGAPSALPPAVRNRVRLCVTLGGDGTLLAASRALGPGATPPVVPFAMGSLGFMTPFAFDGCADPSAAASATLAAALAPAPHPPAGGTITLRHRLRAFVLRNVRDSNPFDALARLTPPTHSSAEGAEAEGEGERDGWAGVVTNELALERAGAGHLATLDVWVDGTFLTTCVGDGLLVSTPTGSTGYALAAGGPVCHPAVDCVLLTPVAPHALAFRPAVFPGDAAFVLRVPLGARGGVACVIDGGEGSVRLQPGDCVVVSRDGAGPLRTLARAGPTEDWIQALCNGLHYNARKK